MKIGIYITGLGQTVQQESVEKYATRLLHEYRFKTTGVSYDLKIEKIGYAPNRESTVASIIEKNDQGEKTIYKIYDFNYNEILVKRFNEHNILVKCALLFLAVIKKMPVLLRRTIKRDAYSHPFQTFYLFLMFFIMSAAVLFMVPAIVELLFGVAESQGFLEFIQKFPRLKEAAKSLGINRSSLKTISEYSVSITALLLILVPQAKVLVTTIATEFVCANYYLELGEQRQEISGNLDQLVEFIAENETDPRIHFHTYSFGSIIGLDYLFPYGNVPSGNTELLTEAIITIGTPVEFIHAYYTGYYQKRNLNLESKICWLNVYSLADALATNFRKDVKAGEAEFGIQKRESAEKNGLKPFNINYEVTNLKEHSLLNFLMLYSFKVHSTYWEETALGQSCVRGILNEMRTRKLV